MKEDFIDKICTTLIVFLSVIVSISLILKLIE